MAKEKLTKEIKIPAIKNGTVIDHIPSRVTLKIIRLVDPQEFEHTISLALNLKSKKIGKKGVIKLSNRFLTKEEVSKVGILAPEATVSIIKDYKIKEKIHVKVSDMIEKIVKCSNPNCITNIEKVKTRFNIVTEHPLKIRCAYCERTMSRDDIKLN
ncbi:MAG: aspartate carbamoyltransferase regulatory subunit [Nanoarchaeota archaeon]|nr:aspartate carbamoyltransferase regulatory subunit [Thermodesulfovibrionia bacterium]MCK5283439.1 aspartate carbamoyltransferase regulatory subunit [Nanoarchaeota archaeon]